MIRFLTISICLVFALNAEGAGRTALTVSGKKLGVGRKGVGITKTAAFEFASSTGAGMGIVCSGTTPTGANGQIVTLAARTGVRSCMKGGETTGIANGDLVKLSANQYAIQPGGNGSGALGIGVWEERVNEAWPSEDYTHVRWVKYGDGVAAPTVTADTAVAPDGTTTADRVQLAATPTNEQSLVYLLNGCPTSNTVSASCFVKGNVGSGTTDFAINDSSSGWISKACTFNNSTWTRCLAEGVILSAGGAVIFGFGNGAGTNGGIARPAVDISLWGCQCEIGTTVSPYIPTTNAPAARGGERVTASYTAAGASVSLGGTLAYASTSIDNAAIVSMSFTASNETNLTTLGAQDRCDFNISNTHAYLDGRNNMLTPVTQAAACTYAPTSRAACAGSECKPLVGALTLPTGAATICIGCLADGGTANGTVKGVCADSASTACRPSDATTVTCPAVTTEAQTVAGVGDSVMVGAYTTKVADVMNDQLCLSGRAFAQFAVSGANIAACTTQYTTNVQGHAYRAVATNCGTNSLSPGDPTGAAAWAEMETLLNLIVADGFHVVVGNITPCGGYSGCVTSAVTGFNALEAAWCAAHPVTATCIDNFTLLGSGSEPLTYSPPRPTVMGSLCLPSSDSLHPNNYCTTKLAVAFAGASP